MTRSGRTGGTRSGAAAVAMIAIAAVAGCSREHIAAPVVGPTASDPEHLRHARSSVSGA